LNDCSPRLVVLLLLSAPLWRRSLGKTLPCPRQFPLDALLFYFVPFWLGLNLDQLTHMGFDLSLSSGMDLGSAAMVAGLALFIGAGAPLLAAQAAMLQRARQLRPALLGVLAVVLPVAFVLLAYSADLSLHFHHWIVGWVGALLFRGQPRRRYSIAVQAAMLGAMCNGVAIWDLAPLFDDVQASASGVPAALLWSGVNVSGTNVTIEWTTVEVVRDVWNCSRRPASGSDDAGGADASPAAVLSHRRHTGASVTASTSRAGASTLPLPRNSATALAVELQAATAAALSSLVPGISMPSCSSPVFALSANGVLLFDEKPFPAAAATSPAGPFHSGAFTSTHDLGLARGQFMLAVASKAEDGSVQGSASEYLRVALLQPGESSAGAGYYNSSSSPCMRVAALNHEYYE
jgi:hypothetical protein